jgi:glutathione S-transferase
MHGGFGHLRNDCTMNVGVRVTPKPMSEGLKRNVARVREIFETGLARFGGPWLAGAEFSAADAFFAPVAFRIRTYGLDVGPSIGGGQAWVDHVLAHPAMLDWEAQALAEEWREEAHEAELAAAGVITADYRK